MKRIAVFPGRFQPFGPNHYSAYKWLINKFTVDDTYIVTSDVTSNTDSPFNFEEKREIILRNYVPYNNIIKVKNPYKAEELISQFDPDNTVVVFMVGEKDAERFRPFKKDGTRGYFQPFNNLPYYDYKPLSVHGYFLTSPTKIIDPMYGQISGTVLRNIIPQLTPKEFKDVMGWYVESTYSMIEEKLTNFKK